MGNISNLSFDDQYHGNFDFSDSHHLKLIDFGVASRYLEKNPVTKQMVHIKLEENQEFLGNIAFCSPHAKKLMSVSRRDDFYCLMYFLSFLATLRIPFSDPSQPLNG